MSEVSSISDDDWTVWRTFHIMRRQLDRALEANLQRNAGISQPEYEILLTLFKAPGRRLRSREIAEITGWEKSRISHQATRMVSRGLVARAACAEDLRGTWLELTADGRRAVLGAMRGHTNAVKQYFFDVLSPEEQQALLVMSTKVLDTIDPPVCDTSDDEDKGRLSA